jgi:hypothetical protein
MVAQMMQGDVKPLGRQRPAAQLMVARSASACRAMSVAVAGSGKIAKNSRSVTGGASKRENWSDTPASCLGFQKRRHGEAEKD